MGLSAGRDFWRMDDVLARSLDAQTMRLRAVAHNLANVNTPGFKRSAVRFESALRQELGRYQRQRLPLQVTHPLHFGLDGATRRPAVPEMVTDHSTSMRNDGNNVDPDREMAELARVQLTYQALIRQVSERYRRLRHVIEQGGR